MPARRMRLISPAAMIALRSLSRPSAVIVPSLQPSARRMSATAPTVPLDPKASSQCARENSEIASSISAAQAICAFLKRERSISPLRKYRIEVVTQPILNDSARSAAKLRPTISSVEAPPMSTTRRRALLVGRVCMQPSNTRRASSRPAMISIG